MTAAMTQVPTATGSGGGQQACVVHNPWSFYHLSICLQSYKIFCKLPRKKWEKNRASCVLYLIVTTVTDCLNLGAKVPDPIAPCHIKVPAPIAPGPFLRLHSGDSTRFLKTGTMKRFAFHVSKCENYCSNNYIIIIYINI